MCRVFQVIFAVQQVNVNRIIISNYRAIFKNAQTILELICTYFYYILQKYTCAALDHHILNVLKTLSISSLIYNIVAKPSLMSSAFILHFNSLKLVLQFFKLPLSSSHIYCTVVLFTPTYLWHNSIYFLLNYTTLTSKKSNF